MPHVNSDYKPSVSSKLDCCYKFKYKNLFFLSYFVKEYNQKSSPFAGWSYILKMPKGIKFNLETPYILLPTLPTSSQNNQNHNCFYIYGAAEAAYFSLFYCILSFCTAFALSFPCILLNVSSFLKNKSFQLTFFGLCAAFYNLCLRAITL